jgi:hypothetical protein
MLPNFSLRSFGYFGEKGSAGQAIPRMAGKQLKRMGKGRNILMQTVLP